jgi:hypothetical protein
VHIFRIEDCAKQATSSALLAARVLLLSDPRDGDSLFLRNVGELVPDYTASRSQKVILITVTAFM